jgi:electron transport complex protein RnfD
VINRSQKIMFTVLACLLPGCLISAWFLGTGILANVALAVTTVFALECIVLHIRNRPLQSAWDGSGIVTAVLLALALPPELPWSIVVFGSGFAIIFGKHLYGGLGQNLFNPAMVGYCALIVSFPLYMSQWPPVVDGLSGATPLDVFKWREGATVEEIWSAENGFGHWGGLGFEWISAAYLAGGIALIALKATRWQAPAATLASVALLSVLFYDSGSSSSLGSPLFHLFSGGLMFAAFFIVTDPVTSPDTGRGLLLFGAGVGCITFIIRSIGAYPDGIAFAVLLMNAVVPLYEQVRVKLS